MIRILLVDDDESVLKTLQHDLQSLHGQMEAFTQPRQALMRAGVATFDLVITGYRLPEMDGRSLIKALKKLQPDLVVIMLIRLVDLRAGMSARRETEIFRHLTKPWNADELCTIAREALLLRGTARSESADASQPKSALAALEARYPGITDPGLDWKPVRR